MFAEALSLLVLLAPAPEFTPEDPEAAKALAKYKASIDRGLQWLVKQQDKDGSWSGHGGQYPTPMTALAGLALLAEGSTRREGKYAANIDRAVQCLTDSQQKNGLISRPLGPVGHGPHGVQVIGDSRYMFGHGYAVLFLSQVYARDPDRERRAELGRVIELAIDFTATAQTTQGGWGYIAAADGGDFDEGACTVTQLHALYAARSAGLKVPMDVTAKGRTYLAKSTVVVQKNEDKAKVEGGVAYSLKNGPQGGARPPLTAAALVCAFSAGEEQSDLALQWLNHCQRQFGVRGLLEDPIPYGEFIHFYYAQAAYKLGDDGHARLRPDLAATEKQDATKQTLLKWSRYREGLFEHFRQQQAADGSWPPGLIGPVYSTSVYLTVMQLDKGHLPAFRRK